MNQLCGVTKNNIFKDSLDCKLYSVPDMKYKFNELNIVRRRQEDPEEKFKIIRKCNRT